MMAPVWLRNPSTKFDISLVKAFEETAEACPTRIAVDSGPWQLTYAQLNVAANRLARSLIDIGGAPQDRAAILMTQDAPAIAAVVGVVKAGLIVVGLNCTDPLARLRQLIDDAEPSVIVTDAANVALATELSRSGSTVLVFDLESDSQTADFSPVAVDSSQTAVLVYTSGSTGRPKGVMKTHRQICRNVAAHSEAMQYSEADRIPLFSSIGTGQGTTVVWCALLNGATLCPFSIRTKGFAGLAAWISDLKLTVFVSSASIGRALVRTLDSGLVFDDIRAVRFASESVTADDVRALRRHFPPDSVFVHTLSSSETGNVAWSRWGHSDHIPDGLIPVGHVSREIEVLLLGEDGQPVEAGKTGELVVKSRYAAAGYWRDPALTAERFSPVLDGRGTHLVRNGDLARVNAQGLIEYCGRNDSRIKIRGNRIEPSDIEWALAKLPGIERSAAVAVTRDNNEPTLVAFVVLSPGASWSTRKLRHAASANLPPHMLPSRFVVLDSLPLGPGGKIDREVLRRYELPRGAAGEPPRGLTETLIADFWIEALGIPGIGRDDDFFDSGGDSLTGAIVAVQIHAAFGIEISLAALAEHSTICDLAAHVDAERKSGAMRLPPIVAVPRTGPIPLSPYQERVWRALERRPGHSVIIRGFDISGPLDVKIMEESFRYLVDRHEILRTTFSVVDGEPAQIVHPSAPLGFAFVDVSGEENPEAAADLIFEAEAGKLIDPAVLPIMRFLLVRINKEKHWLLRPRHALGQDASSFAIFMNEFATLYDAATRKMAPPIPRDMPLQYADYAVWHRELMRPDGVAYRQMLDWWKQIFAKRLRTTWPLRRITARRNADPRQATHHWLLEDHFAERLDAIARRAGATHFVIRLACFVALLADMTGKSAVALGTSFTRRQRGDTRNILGLFTNLAPLVFSYRSDLVLSHWLEMVRNRLFETERHAELPFETLYSELRASGLRPPSIQIIFTMASDWSEQRMSGIVMKRLPAPLPEMPWGYNIYIDQKTPANCRVEFDANLYRMDDIKAMTDRYVRLLEAAAEHPDLPIGRLVARTRDSRLRQIAARIRIALSVKSL